MRENEEVITIEDPVLKYLGEISYGPFTITLEFLDAFTILALMLVSRNHKNAIKQFTSTEYNKTNIQARINRLFIDLEEGKLNFEQKIIHHRDILNTIISFNSIIGNPRNVDFGKLAGFRENLKVKDSMMQKFIIQNKITTYLILPLVAKAEQPSLIDNSLVENVENKYASKIYVIHAIIKCQLFLAMACWFILTATGLMFAARFISRIFGRSDMYPILEEAYNIVLSGEAQYSNSTYLCHPTPTPTPCKITPVFAFFILALEGVPLVLLGAAPLAMIIVAPLTCCLLYMACKLKQKRSMVRGTISFFKEAPYDNHEEELYSVSGADSNLSDETAPLLG